MEARNKGIVLFTPSGCLSREAMLASLSGELGQEEQVGVKDHLGACEFCQTALLGLQAFAAEHDLDSLPGILQETTRELDALPSHPLLMERNRMVRIGRLHALVAVAATIALFFGLAYVIRLWLPVQAPGLAENLPAVKDSLVTDTFVQSFIAGEKETGTGSKPASRPFATPVLPGDIAIYQEDNIAAVTLQDTVQENKVTEGDASLGLPAKEEKSPAALADDLAGGVKAETLRQHKRLAPAGEKPSKSVAQINATGVNRDREAFAMVEEMPVFPGGDDSLKAFLERHIAYPLLARESGVTGIVYLSFIVDRQGRIKNERVLRGIGSGCDEEALRVLRLMPRWQAGKQAGKKVDVQFTLPVKFSL